VGAFELHRLVEQDGDGPGRALDAVLGQQFHDLVEGGTLHLVGHRRSVSLAWRGNPSREPAVTSRLKRRRIYRNDAALGNVWRWLPVFVT
jgi:hypothetical protein